MSHATKCTISITLVIYNYSKTDKPLIHISRKPEKPVVKFDWRNGGNETFDFNYFFAKIGDRVISHREPNPDEARIQAMSVIAACAKGLMYFQSEVSIIIIHQRKSYVLSK